MKAISTRTFLGTFLILALAAPTAGAQLATRDKRWPTRGPWMWELPRALPALYWEFNGIDFGHAHVGETLLRTQDHAEVERARLEVLDFIFSRPKVPPDEEQIAPTLVRLVWEVQRTFNWTHSFHRSLYDLFASDEVPDKETAYHRILGDYLSKPEAITPHPLDHHGKLWSWPESKAFRDRFRKFNTQIWAYHWLQAAAYDVQLMGPAAKQREWMPRIIRHYHGYLRNPPEEWQVMPMMMEAAPEFTMKFPEAANIFDNLHMLHDNLDDVLSRPDLYPAHNARREQILKILDIYLHRNHTGRDRYAEYHAPMHAAHVGGMDQMQTGHDSAQRSRAHDQRQKTAQEQPAHGKLGDEIPPGRQHTGEHRGTGHEGQTARAKSHEQHGAQTEKADAMRHGDPKRQMGGVPRQKQMQSGTRGMENMGPRPPSAQDVLEGRTGNKVSESGDEGHRGQRGQQHGGSRAPEKSSDQQSGKEHKH